MKLYFLALYKVFDFSQIGGTDSFMRRLTNGLLEIDHNLRIEWLFYGSEFKKTINHSNRFSSRYFCKFDELLEYVYDTKPEHVVCTWIYPRDRIKFAHFRRNNKKIVFHKIEFFYPENSLIRLLKFSDLLIYPYNGKIFCVSYRQLNYLKKLSRNCVLILPPVPEYYFLKPEDKPKSEKINLTFIGRIDPRKGIEETLRLFDYLKQDNKFHISIMGIYIKNDPGVTASLNYLRDNFKGSYILLDRNGYNDEVEHKVFEVLKGTDIFFQPYRNLDSTVDTPLLLLEGMATLCTIVTTDISNVKNYYGNSSFIFKPINFLEDAKRFLTNISYEIILKERLRIYEEIKKVRCSVSKVSESFLDNIK